ncbi:NADP-binding protein [Dacryopinax primogenitus]|uniref:NADP-binding protein n=1 Tax=Dacryopinax primogenitus (strain DJM 731) TaxID=1858805 RepID=M5G8J4_DACPD|nr:NADP-binding protein [Dacryopinax primogenitus]EJU04490.1 NADP-binding protein [Dacryopinax primogenitus]
MTAVQKHFFGAETFAVVGASTDKSKFGNKVFMWYLDHSKPVTPIHPKEPSIESVPALTSLSALPSPKMTSVSVVTPAKVTLSVLKEAKELGVWAVWIQPGASDDACAEWIKENEMEDKVIYGGPCILRDGEAVMALIGQ